MLWFSELFGFVERDFSYDEVRAHFDYDRNTGLLRTGEKTFKAGKFSCPSVNELWQQLTSIPRPDLGGSTYSTIAGDTTLNHEDPDNAGAVFLAASQFNCLEMIQPKVRPEDGITWYVRDHTQGPACAMACPAGTIVRNYLCGEDGKGQGHGRQIDNLADVGQLLGNGDSSIWTMKNGYCLPSSKDSMKRLSARLLDDPSLVDNVRGLLRVGVMADTQVQRRDGPPHCVHQVYASALPVAYARSTPDADWAAFATVILEGSYEAVLLYSAILARTRGKRVRVYLTCLGGGAFGNDMDWIHHAIKRAVHVSISETSFARITRWQRGERHTIRNTLYCRSFFWN
eukprot:m.373597 g.373597  ORF g.373597 m.373597 type:complete len:342 (-) comp20888_c0_seq2:1926-2951(-)